MKIWAQFKTDFNNSVEYAKNFDEKNIKDFSKTIDKLENAYYSSFNKFALPEGSKMSANDLRKFFKDNSQYVKDFIFDKIKEVTIPKAFDKTSSVKVGDLINSTSSENLLDYVENMKKETFTGLLKYYSDYLSLLKNNESISESAKSLSLNFSNFLKNIMESKSFVVENFIRPVLKSKIVTDEMYESYYGHIIQSSITAFKSALTRLNSKAQNLENDNDSNVTKKFAKLFDDYLSWVFIYNIIRVYTLNSLVSKDNVKKDESFNESDFMEKFTPISNLKSFFDFEKEKAIKSFTYEDPNFELNKKLEKEDIDKYANDFLNELSKAITERESEKNDMKNRLKDLNDLLDNFINERSIEEDILENSVLSFYNSNKEIVLKDITGASRNFNEILLYEKDKEGNFYQVKKEKLEPNKVYYNFAGSPTQCLERLRDEIDTINIDLLKDAKGNSVLEGFVNKIADGLKNFFEAETYNDKSSEYEKLNDIFSNLNEKNETINELRKNIRFACESDILDKNAEILNTSDELSSMVKTTIEDKKKDSKSLVDEIHERKWAEPNSLASQINKSIRDYRVTVMSQIDESKSSIDDIKNSYQPYLKSAKDIITSKYKVPETGKETVSIFGSYDENVVKSLLKNSLIQYSNSMNLFYKQLDGLFANIVGFRSLSKVNQFAISKVFSNEYYNLFFKDTIKDLGTSVKNDFNTLLEINDKNTYGFIVFIKDNLVFKTVREFLEKFESDNYLLRSGWNDDLDSSGSSLGYVSLLLNPERISEAFINLSESDKDNEVIKLPPRYFLSCCLFVNKGKSRDFVPRLNNAVSTNLFGNDGEKFINLATSVGHKYLKIPSDEIKYGMKTEDKLIEALKNDLRLNTLEFEDVKNNKLAPQVTKVAKILWKDLNINPDSFIVTGFNDVFNKNLVSKYFITLHILEKKVSIYKNKLNEKNKETLKEVYHFTEDDFK